MKLNQLPLLLALLALVSCGPEDTPEVMSDAAPSEEASAWTVLFDGTSLDAFRGYRMETVPSGWTIEGETLTFDPEGERGDLMTREQYEDFELAWEWKMEPEGNSGVIYLVSEDYDAPWHTGPEYQLIDDDGYPGELNDVQRTGSNYDVNAPTVDALNPPGEWNTSRIVVDGSHVEHWLNGQKVVEYELGSDRWEAEVAETKFAEFPDYGRNAQGHIVFQDHGDPIWFRNIRVREL